MIHIRRLRAQRGCRCKFVHARVGAYMQMFRLKQVINVTGLSRMTIWRLERAGEFPQRRQLGLRSVAWLQSEVEEWIERRPVARRAGEEARRQSARSRARSVDMNHFTCSTKR
jgi:prophage regulatory protein